MSEVYRNEQVDDQDMKDRMLMVWPYGKYAMIIFTAGRAILVLISLRYPKICYYYVLYDQILVLIDQLLPRNYDASQANLTLLLF